MTADWQTLQQLYQTLLSRRDADPSESYTASLLARGTPTIARKLGEEALETVIAASGGNREEVISESADLLYHLLVLWVRMGVEPAEVLATLQQREGTSGLEEKRNRKEK